MQLKVQLKNQIANFGRKEWYFLIRRTNPENEPNNLIIDMRFKSSVARIILIFGIFLLTASSRSADKTHTDTDLETQLEYYHDQAYIHAHVFDNIKKADSFSYLGIRLAESSFREDLMLEAYFRFLENTNLQPTRREIEEIIERAERICRSADQPDDLWRIAHIKAMSFLQSFNYDHALDQSYRALTIAETNNSNTQKVKSYLLIGQSQAGKNQKIEGFRNYLNALYLAEKLNDQDLLKSCYWHLARYFNLNKYLDKALEYKMKEAQLLLGQSPVDSTALMWVQVELEEIMFNSNNNELNRSNIDRILNYANRHQNSKIKNYTLALYRTHLIEADDLAGLYELYKLKYPRELDKISRNSPSTFLRLQAYFYEVENKPDSALLYFNLADSAVSGLSNKVMLSNFNMRFGQHLNRQNKPTAAIEKLKLALDFAREVSYIQYILIATKELEKIYLAEGDFENTYRYANIYHSYKDSLDVITQKDELLRLEIDNETRQQELKIKLEKRATLRRHNLQYMGIVIALATIFVFLIMLGNFKVQEWIVRMLGFFSFIFLFEFIILLADQKIHHMTHGEPWMIMLIKIFLIAILLPFHHWIEGKVIKYLLNNKLINLSGISFKKFFIGWSKKH